MQLTDDESKAYAEFQTATREQAAAEQALAKTQQRLQAAQLALYQFALKVEAPK